MGGMRKTLLRVPRPGEPASRASCRSELRYFSSVSPCCNSSRYPRRRFVRVEANVRTAIVACLSLSLCGCVPALRHEFYLPAAPGGKVLTNPCWRTQETIRFDRPAFLAEMNVMGRGGKQFVEVRWEIQPGKTLELAQSNARVSLGNQTEAVDTDLHLSLVGSAMELQPVRPMAGGYLPPPVETALRNYWIYVALPEQPGDSFRVLLPAFSVDGKADSLPEVRFTKQSSVQYFAPIQC